MRRNAAAARGRSRKGGADPIDRTGTGPEGLILCGGAGSRVDGRDKGLLDAGDGEPAVLHAARLLRPLCSRVFVSANRNRRRYAALAIGPVLVDLREDFAGPLAGLEAAAAVMKSDRLLLLPCDLPDLSPQVPRVLLSRLAVAANCDAVYARAAGHGHYLVACLRRRAVATAGAALDQGRGAVRGWLASLEAEAVDFSGDVAATFVNRNRPVDWGLP